VRLLETRHVDAKVGVVKPDSSYMARTVTMSSSGAPYGDATEVVVGLRSTVMVKLRLLVEPEGSSPCRVTSHTYQRGAAATSNP
jgi:hypothetical protein